MISQDLLNAVFSTDMKIGTISAPIDQSWWFFRLTWSFPLYQLVLWWLEVSTWTSRWLQLAEKMFSHQTLYAAYTMRVWRTDSKCRCPECRSLFAADPLPRYPKCHPPFANWDKCRSVTFATAHLPFCDKCRPKLPPNTVTFLPMWLLPLWDNCHWIPLFAM